MAQFDPGSNTDADDGTELVDRQNSIGLAALTNNIGPTEPTYTEDGMWWVDDSGSDGIWELKFRLEGEWVLIMEFDPSSGVAAGIPNIDNFTNAIHSHADAEGGGQIATANLTGHNKTIHDALGIDANSADKLIDQGGGSNLLCKIIEIGDWDMDAIHGVGIAHGLTLSKIRNVQAIVRNDSGSSFIPLTPGVSDVPTVEWEGWIAKIDSTDVTLAIRAGSIFDTVTYDSTSYNRGWITIWYTV